MTAKIFDGLAEGFQAPEPLGFAVAVRGRLHVAVYSEDADVWTLGFRLDKTQLQFKTDQAGRPDRTQDLEREMRAEVLVSMEKSGRIRDFVTPESMSVEASNFWIDLLASFQVELPAKAGEASWTANESDTTGDYIATYRRANPKKPGEIVKSKGEYVHLHGQEEPPEAITFDASSAIELERVVRSIHGTEKLSLSSGGSEIESDVEVSFELVENAADPRILHRSRLVQDEIRDGARRVIGAAESPVSQEDGVPPVQTIATALDGLIALHRSGGAGSADEAALMAKIVDLIRRDPAVVAVVLERLQSNEATDELAAVLLGALGAAGTEAAQSGLVEVFASANWDESRRFTALTALAQVEEPTPLVFESLEALRAEETELAANALLLLGAMGSRVRTSDPARFAEVRDELLELGSTLPGASDLESHREVLILEALKNVRLESTPTFIERLYESGDDIARAEVVSYFEHTFDERANDILFRAIAQDPSESVRAAAAAVLPSAERGIELAIIEGIVASDPSVEVRKAAVRTLAERAQSEREVVDLLANIAETNDSDEVRAIAAEAVAKE